MLSHLLPLIVFGVWLLAHCTVGQIPAVCTDKDSLENLRCCPMTPDGVCGENANRGKCVELKIDGYSRNTTDVRGNWPHYFTHVSLMYVHHKVNSAGNDEECYAKMCAENAIL